MTTEQTDAWKRVSNAGLVLVIFGWIGLVVSIIFIIISIILITANFQIPSDSGDPLQSWMIGIIFLLVFLLSLPLAIVNIIGGNKLRKPVPNPRGWLIYCVVIGAIGITSLPGILELIFGIMALSTLHAIEGAQPPSQV